MKTFYFNTGVNLSVYPNLMKGQISGPNNVKLIPFDCADVPNNATFKCACDNPNLYNDYPNIIMREIHNSALCSKYAYFTIN
jgi:hypothetical protein